VSIGLRLDQSAPVSMGTTSRLLIENHCSPRTVRTVALCGANDAVLRPLAERFGIEIVVDDQATRSIRGDVANPEIPPFDEFTFDGVPRGPAA
jgi:hypothetical protein